MSREHKGAEFIDSVREVLGLSPWYGSIRAEAERLGTYSSGWTIDPQDNGNLRTMRVGAETTPKGKPSAQWL